MKWRMTLGLRSLLGIASLGSTFCVLFHQRFKPRTLFSLAGGNEQRCVALWKTQLKVIAGASLTNPLPIASLSLFY